MHTISTYNTQALARRLNSPDQHERQQAQDELRTLLAADVRCIKHVRAMQNFMSLGYGLFAMFAGFTRISGFMLPSVSAFCGVQYLFSLPARHAAHRIAALDIPQAVGPLVEVMLTSGWFRFRHVEKALIRLLPQLHPADARLLTPLQRKYMGWMLVRDECFPYNGRFWGADLKIAILRALQQVGDEKAISQVEKTARAAHDWRVRAAARECLPFLQQRVQQQDIEQTLLRASIQTTAPGILLRPASLAATTVPQTLLRASIASVANDAY